MPRLDNRIGNSRAPVYSDLYVPLIGTPRVGTRLKGAPHILNVTVFWSIAWGPLLVDACWCSSCGPRVRWTPFRIWALRAPIYRGVFWTWLSTLVGKFQLGGRRGSVCTAFDLRSRGPGSDNRWDAAAVSKTIFSLPLLGKQFGVNCYIRHPAHDLPSRNGYLVFRLGKGNCSPRNSRVYRWT